MSLRSRRHEDLNNSPFVFESVNCTDDGRVLITFTQHNEDEACTILDNLPLFIQHEMNIDPSFFLSADFLRMCQGNYYNPLTRTGITAVAQSLIETQIIEPNPRMRIPRGIRESNARELEKIFKRQDNCMFTFKEDEDLKSLADSVSSYKPIPEKSVEEVGTVMNLQTLLQTHHRAKGNNEEVSVLSEGSGYSFDSQASRARFEIEKRADAKVQEALKESKLKQGVQLYHIGQLTPELAAVLNIDIQDVLTYIGQGQEIDNREALNDMDEAVLDPHSTEQDGEKFPQTQHSQLLTHENPDGRNYQPDNHNPVEETNEVMETEDNWNFEDNDPPADCDMSHSSDKTLPSGSPSKKAPDGHNIGLPS
jgi:hypothetical protein